MCLVDCPRGLVVLPMCNIEHGLSYAEAVPHDWNVNCEAHPGG